MTPTFSPLRLRLQGSWRWASVLAWLCLASPAVPQTGNVVDFYATGDSLAYGVNLAAQRNEAYLEQTVFGGYVDLQLDPRFGVVSEGLNRPRPQWRVPGSGRTDGKDQVLFKALKRSADRGRKVVVLFTIGSNDTPQFRNYAATRLYLNTHYKAHIDKILQTAGSNATAVVLGTYATPGGRYNSHNQPLALFNQALQDFAADHGYIAYIPPNKTAVDQSDGIHYKFPAYRTLAQQAIQLGQAMPSYSDALTSQF